MLRRRRVEIGPPGDSGQHLEQPVKGKEGEAGAQSWEVEPKGPEDQLSPEADLHGWCSLQQHPAAKAGKSGWVMIGFPAENVAN